MSRIGIKPITLPAGVEVKIDGNVVSVKGPKGELQETISSLLTVENKDGVVTVRMLGACAGCFMANADISEGVQAILIDEIPEGEFFHITHLMEKIKVRGGRVGCFPVSEHSWKDMGEWPEYLKMINVL